MKIIVTGALGHIGSQFIRDLPVAVSGELEVTLVDNLLTQRFSSLFNLPNSIRYRFIEGDVRKLDLQKLFRGADVVVHLAAITDASGSFEREQEVHENNLGATKLVAGAASIEGVKLIFVSSTSVYGTQSSRVSEDCSEDELAPQSPYAVVKLKEEEIVRELVNVEGLKAVICRFGTIFGCSPGMRFHTAINKFCWQAVLGQPLTVWETAYDQLRPYLYLRDATKALAFIIQNKIFDGRIYNVLTGNYTVRDVVDSISVSYPELKVSFVTNRIMNQLSYEVSNAKFTALGFDVQGTLVNGVNETIALLQNACHRSLRSY